MGHADTGPARRLRQRHQHARRDGADRRPAPTRARAGHRRAAAHRCDRSGLPTVAAPPTATASGIPEGLTTEGYHVLGRADAPVTLINYSDFL